MFADDDSIDFAIPHLTISLATHVISSSSDDENVQVTGNIKTN